jgi:endonuclease-3
MTLQERARIAVSLLEKQYPQALCSLRYEKPHELLISVRLSAQCTDARVNLVTPALFSHYKSIEDFAKADVKDIEEFIKSCGLYKTKARDIVGTAKMLMNEFGGSIPNTIEELLRLPGVGRKTANLILGDLFGQPAVVCDTHCIRISNFIGLTNSKDPDKAEKDLRNCLPMEKANDFCHRLVLHGRAVCVARRPLCAQCSLLVLCSTGLSKTKEESQNN